MRHRLYAQLCAIVRREGRDANAAEDVVQEALVIAIEAGRHDLADPANGRWLTGVVRNRARMASRSARRCRLREHDWQASRDATPPDAGSLAETLGGLPPALRTLAALVLTGHNRREIAYLLNLPDTALRQRISALKRQLRAQGLVAPDGFPGLNLDLAYGRIRDALLPKLIRQGGMFASHDPDGHLFVVRRSQSGTPRQQGMQPSPKGSST